MIANQITGHAARHRLAFLSKHATAIHHHTCSAGDTWRVDFFIDEADDVAFGVTLDAAIDEAMRRSRMPIPPLLMHSPGDAQAHATRNGQAEPRMPRKWLGA